MTEDGKGVNQADWAIAFVVGKDFCTDRIDGIYGTQRHRYDIDYECDVLENVSDKCRFKDCPRKVEKQPVTKGDQEDWNVIIRTSRSYCPFLPGSPKCPLPPDSKGGIICNHDLNRTGHCNELTCTIRDRTQPHLSNIPKKGKKCKVCGREIRESEDFQIHVIVFGDGLQVPEYSCDNCWG